MNFASVKDSVELINASLGILTAMIGVTFGVLTYRLSVRQGQKPPPQPQPPPAPGMPYAMPAPRPPSRFRISVKAIVSALLGVLAAMFTGLVSLSAALGDPREDIVEAAIYALGIAVAGTVIGLVARSDIKRDPGRLGKTLATVGIITSIVAGAVAFSTTQTPTEPLAQDPTGSGVGLGTPAAPSTTPVSEPSPAATDDVRRVAEVLAQPVADELKRQLVLGDVAVAALNCTVPLNGAGTCQGTATQSFALVLQYAISVNYEYVDPGAQVPTFFVTYLPTD